jgi:hypothetical protein
VEQNNSGVTSRNWNTTTSSALLRPSQMGWTAGKQNEELVKSRRSQGTDIQQRSAHENPVIFYSMAIGFLGESTVPLPSSISFSSTLSGLYFRNDGLRDIYGGLMGNKGYN